jgi:GDPmannose 4,6-dehydratase
MPEYTGDITGLGTTRLLEAIRRSGVKTRFYQAASSEMFGDAPAPQNERTPFHPCSPYAAAKLYGYWMTRLYREGYQIFACNGILFNHESPRRGETFVTRKITRGLAHILAGRQRWLYLGNLAAQRDWGYAPEYVQMMWRMLQQDQPDDYVLGTGEAHTVQEFVEAAFSYVGLDWHEYVKIDARYYRPLEVEHLRADAAKARAALDWHPRVTFKELVKIMVDADMEALGLQPPGEGKRILQEKFNDWHHWECSVTASLTAAEQGLE